MPAKLSYRTMLPLLLLWQLPFAGSVVQAITPVRPKSELRLKEHESQPLQAHIDVAQATREDSLRILQAADTITTTVSATEADTLQGVDIKVDKKVVYPRALGMPESNTLREVLEFIPELLNRGSDDLLSNFALQVDDQDFGLGQDVLLSTLRLSEIESIEITTSPAASAQKAGQGGIINVHLKPVTKGLSGSATADIYSNLRNSVNVSPAVFVNYGQEKWQMRAGAVLEYYRPVTHEMREIRTRDIDATNGRDTTTLLPDTTRAHNIQETAKLHFEYNPTTQDHLTFAVLESMSWQITDNHTQATTHQPIDGYTDLIRETRTPITQQNKAHRFNFLSQIKYKHDYLTGGKFETSLLYTYRRQHDSSAKQFPTLTDSTMLPWQEHTRTSQAPHEIQFNISTKHPICPVQLGLYDSEMWLTFEVNTSYTDARSTLYQDGMRARIVDYEQELPLRSQQLYVSPVLQWDYRIGRIQLQAGARYQMLRRRIHKPAQNDWLNHEHDITANINAVWKITHEHSLRLAIARNIARPTDEQIFPFPYYLPASRELLIGNDSLHSAYFHNIGINYVYNHTFANPADGRIITNVGIEYIRADGMIRKQRRTYTTPYGAVLYKTYTNASVGNVLSATASLFLRYKMFSLSFSGNLYANLQEANSQENHYWYYNLSLSPVFAFRHRWTLSGKMMYNSRIETASSMLGDCFYVRLRLSKDIGRWNIHAELSDLFDVQTVDRSTATKEQYITSGGMPVSLLQQTESVTRTYDLYQRLLMIGVVYHF